MPIHKLHPLYAALVFLLISVCSSCQGKKQGNKIGEEIETNTKPTPDSDNANSKTDIDDGYAFIYKELPKDISPKVFKTLPLASGSALYVSVFVGKNKNSGTTDNGFAVWTKKETGEKTTLWYADGFKNSAPHTFSACDLNHDGLWDIVCYAGEENAHSTLFYLSQKKPTEFFPGNFKLGLEAKDAYATVVDLDFDGKPEILDRISRREFILNEMEKKVPDHIMDEINGVYRQIAKGFERTHFSYNHSKASPYFNIFITEPFRIWHYEGDGFAEKTGAYPQHLKWRKDIIAQLLDVATTKEKESLELLLKELDEYLEK